MVDEVEVPPVEPLPQQGAMRLGERPDLVDDLPLSVEVIVGATELKLAELFAMAPGAVLALDREVDGPLELRVRGKTVAQGVLVAVGDRFGVRITEVTGQ